MSPWLEWPLALAVTLAVVVCGWRVTGAPLSSRASRTPSSSRFASGRSTQRRREFVELVPLVLEDLPDYPVNVIAESVGRALGLRVKAKASGSVEVYTDDRSLYVVGEDEPMDIWPPLQMELTWR